MHPFSLWSSPTICWSTCCMTLGTCVFNHVKLTVRTNCYKKHHIKKATEISKKFSEWKQAPHVGMVGLIPQHFHATPTSCAICQCTPKNSLAYLYTLNEQGTQHCSLQSLPLIQICHVQISRHYHSFCIQARQTISAMLSITTTLYIAATHNTTHSPCMHFQPPITVLCIQLTNKAYLSR